MTNGNRQLIAVTPELLREHLFHANRVPFWDYDPERITYGLELEYFVAKKGSGGRDLAKQRDFYDLIKILISSHMYEDHHVPDQPGRISKETSAGFIAVKPDFAWHILEIALPPRAIIEDIIKMVTDVTSEIDEALNSLGLERLNCSCLPDLSVEYELVDTPKFRTHWPLQAAHKDNSRFALNNFAAFMASIQVHMNILDESFFTILKDLYANDYPSSERPRVQETFEGEPFGDLRTKLYESGLGENYLLRTVPDEIPTSIESYCEQLNRSARLFPGSQFFSVKDLSYIRPTTLGTIEFRSTGTTLDPSEIERILFKRRNQFLQSFQNIDGKNKVI